jgi:hypothetical protein
MLLAMAMQAGSAVGGDVNIGTGVLGASVKASAVGGGVNTGASVAESIGVGVRGTGVNEMTGGGLGVSVAGDGVTGVPVSNAGVGMLVSIAACCEGNGVGSGVGTADGSGVGLWLSGVAVAGTKPVHGSETWHRPYSDVMLLPELTRRFAHTYPPCGSVDRRNPCRPCLSGRRRRKARRDQIGCGRVGVARRRADATGRY